MEGYPVTVGRYEILRPLAEGGFGQVYLARMGGAAGFHRTVAIKRIRFEYTSSPDFVSDFIKEARIGGYLQHHNVVQVFGFDQIGGHYLLIMEFVDGIGLDNVVNYARTHGEHLPLPVIAEIVAQAADGLQYIHTLVSPEGQPLQLIHRDLKPSNLLIGRAGLVKITDFGVARAAIEGGKRTQVGAIKGTLAYLSPEQARGEPLDSRSDLYSLGTILYELLTLDRLFGEDQPYVLLGRLGDNKIDDQLAALPARALPFQPILRRLLTVTAAERIATAGEVAEELRALARNVAEPGVSLHSFAARLVDAVEAERHGAPELTSVSPSQDPMIAWTMTGNGNPLGAQNGANQTLLYGETDTTGSGLPKPGLTPANNMAATRIERPSSSSGRSNLPISNSDLVASSRGRNSYLALAGGAVIVMAIAGYLMFGRSESEEVVTGSQNKVAQAGSNPGSGASSAGNPASPGVAGGGPGVGGLSGSSPGQGGSLAGASESSANPGVTQNSRVGNTAGSAGEAGQSGENASSSARISGSAGESSGNPGATHSGPNGAGSSVKSTGASPTAVSAGSAPAGAGAGGAATQASTGAGGQSGHGGASSPGEPAASHAASREEVGKKAEEGGAEPARSPRETRKAAAEPVNPGGASPGKLIVTSRPSAQVYVDGKSIGETPLRGIDWPPGNYTIRLSRPDLQFQQTAQVQVKAGGTVRLTCLTEGCDVTYP